MYRRPGIGIIMIFVLAAALLIARYLILGGATTEVTISRAPALTGVVSQSLSASQHATNLPQAGKDYNLQVVKYFDNQMWVIANIKPVGNQFDPGFVVLEKLHGSYEVVLGPGSTFNSSYKPALPNDVSQYLSQLGVFYESVD